MAVGTDPPPVEAVMATASGVRGNLRLRVAMISRRSTDFPVPTQSRDQNGGAYRALGGCMGSDATFRYPPALPV